MPEKLSDYYNWNNYPYVGGRAATPVNAYLDGMSKQGHLIEVNKVLDSLGSITFEDVKGRKGYLGQEMAFAEQCIVKELHLLKLPPDSYKRYEIAMLIDYLLHTTLLYVSTINAKGDKVNFLCTKSIPLLNTLKENIDPEDRAKLNNHYFSEQVKLQYTEVLDKKFNCIWLRPEHGGWKLRRYKFIYKREMCITTFHILINYRKKIEKSLIEGVRVIKYKDNGQIREIKTTLEPNLLKSWSKANEIDETPFRLQCDPFIFSHLLVPDLKGKEAVNIDVLDIIEIKQAINYVEGVSKANATKALKAPTKGSFNKASQW